MEILLLLTSSGQEWQFLLISSCSGKMTLLLTFSGQEWQFHIATDI